MTSLPKTKSRDTPIEPLRPLGQAGTDLWVSSYPDHLSRAAREILQVLCEQVDERVALRISVLRSGLPTDRRALRHLDAQIADGLTWLMSETQRVSATEEETLVDELARRRSDRISGATASSSPGRRSQQRRRGSGGTG